MTRPLGIAVAGLGRRGLFHLERLLLRDDCKVVVGCDPLAAARERATGLVPHCVDSFAEVLRDPKVDVVWIAVTSHRQFALARQALLANRDVVVETPVADRDDECQELHRLAISRGKSIVPLLPRRFDEDFRAVEGVVTSGDIGPLWSIERTVWQLGPTDRELESDAGDSVRNALLRVFGLVDQVLRLAGGLPTEVWCRLRSHPGAAQVLAGLQLQLNYHSGPTIWLNYAWSTPAVLDTGWRIQGAAGSFVDGVMSTATASGELIDVPRTPPELDPSAFHNAVFPRIRCGPGREVKWHDGGEARWIWR
ncbi:MAG: Gfo/Idh/MocA family oxidoreductase [Planctomycetota bacterium]|nr:Gfo/Idh/MocA family oxidoreductase [Planctomycetota bacterium]